MGKNNVSNEAEGRRKGNLTLHGPIVIVGDTTFPVLYIERNWILCMAGAANEMNGTVDDCGDVGIYRVSKKKECTHAF